MSMEKLLSHYNWSNEDETNMKKLSPFFDQHREEFITKFHEHIKSTEGIDSVLNSKKIMSRHQYALGEWFVKLGKGPHDKNYIRSLVQIGLKYRKIDLPAHFINYSFTFIREYITDIIHANWERGEERDAIRKTLNRLIDINIYIISMSFREEEMRLYFSSSRFNKFLIGWASHFSVLMDSFLTMFLVILAFLVAGYSIYEVVLVIQNPYDVSKSVLGILGNLLILWAISELLEENIKHLRGGKFAIKIFVAVGLAAIVREILIVSLAHKYDALGVMTFTLIALGIVYYLLARSEFRYDHANRYKEET